MCRRIARLLVGGVALVATAGAFPVLRGQRLRSNSLFSGPEDASFMASLSGRVGQLRDQEEKDNRNVARNWRTAMWTNRGFVLEGVQISQVTCTPLAVYASCPCVLLPPSPSAPSTVHLCPVDRFLYLVTGRWRWELPTAWFTFSTSATSVSQSSAAGGARAPLTAVAAAMARPTATTVR